MTAPVYFVTGAPGSGKTTFAVLLARHLSPTPALLDKDDMFIAIDRAVLAAVHEEPMFGDSSWYGTHLKPGSYEGMLATARRNRANGCAVIITAPFTSQREDPTAWAQTVERSGGPPAVHIWIRADAESTRARLTQRDQLYDRYALAHFDEHAERVRADLPPAVPHIEIDNRLGAPSLESQLRLCDQLLAVENGGVL